MNVILRRARITRLKLLIAKLLFFFVKIFYWENLQKVKRKGINLELDLNQGIDLSLFLFGDFQKHIYDNKLVQLPQEGVVFDVGANSGIISLMFAKKLNNGRVHSFEPTHYAIDRFRKNLELNLDLKKRIEVIQCFISSSSEADPNLESYSSWPIISDSDKHEIHRGVIKSAKDIPSITLDKYCERVKINRIDLIKIDTDGHELEILQGAKKTIKEHSPPIIFEVGIYLLDERKISFNDYLDFFNACQYHLVTIKGQLVTELNFLDFIPQYGTTDLIALPTNKTSFRTLKKR